jgi:uncharacterized protein with beta-barrel porin domain
MLTVRRAWLDPVGELRYSSVTHPSFTEAGADSINLMDVGRARHESLRTPIGGRARWEPVLWGARVRPEMNLSWERESRDRRGALTGALAGRTGLASASRSRGHPAQVMPWC